MHISDPSNGIIGSNGVVGANGPLACGAALSIKVKNIKDRVAVCYTGDGAVNSGAMMEAMNLAGVLKLPLIFVLKNNQYAISTHVTRASACTDFTKRAEAFGLDCAETDGNDVLGVFEAAKKARESVLAAGKPYLLICDTYRIPGHSRTDNKVYRSEAEINFWKEKDPIRLFTDKLLSEGILSRGDIDLICSGAEAKIEEAARKALSGPAADMSARALEKAVYASEG